MKKNNILFIMVAISMLIPEYSYAQGVPSVGTMFANFSTSSLALTRLVQYVSFAIGIFLIIGSIFKFSQLGSNPQMSPKVPFTMFFVGIGIFALTSSIEVLKTTMAMGAGPGNDLMALPISGVSAAASAAIKGVLVFIRLVGFIAFIRGWLLINQYGMGKEGTLSRGLTHLGGGVAAINVDITAKILANSFAPGSSFSGLF